MRSLNGNSNLLRYAVLPQIKTKIIHFHYICHQGVRVSSASHKLAEKDELVRVQSLFGAAEALFSSSYAKMYKATLNTSPGAF